MNLDIRYGNEYPSGDLSNLAPHQFVFDGVFCASMEGLLQSFKFQNIKEQEYCCSLYGFKAKFYGKGVQWYTTQQLWWRGVVFNRSSRQYQELLEIAYKTLFTQNKEARKALLDTNDRILTHEVGTTNPQFTILTKKEFCGILMDIRKEIQLEDMLEF